jgi:hypothetical protein
MNSLFREALSAVLQGIGWMIGTAICGLPLLRSTCLFGRP